MLRLAYSAPDTRCQRLSLVAPAPSLSTSFTANTRKRATPQTQVSHSPYNLLFYMYYLVEILPSSSAKSDGVHEQLALRYTAYSSFMSSLTRISSRARVLALRYTAYSSLKDGHTVDHLFAKVRTSAWAFPFFIIISQCCGGWLDRGAAVRDRSARALALWLGPAAYLQPLILIAACSLMLWLVKDDCRYIAAKRALSPLYLRTW